MESVPAPPARAASASALVACGALLLAFTVISWSAVATKSATVDEPVHALGGWTAVHQHDYRIDPDNPPLFHLLVGLANKPDALRQDFSSPKWTKEPQQIWLQYNWTIQTLYETPGNNPDRFIRHGRAVMLIVGVGLGILICRWAWVLGGPVAAVVATALFSFDPTFLGHAPLVKDDVLLSLAMSGLSLALWRGGQRLTGRTFFAIVVLTAATVMAKWSGLIALLLVPLILALRAVLPQPWPALGRLWTSWSGRLLIAAIGTFAAWAGTYLALWGAFGFRFAPTPDPAVRFDTALLQQVAIENEMLSRSGAEPSPEQRVTARPGLFLQAMAAAERNRLLPQACIEGLLYTYQAALVRPTFLLGERSMTGCWYYFPVAIAVKTPLATLAAMVLAIAALAAMVALRTGAATADAFPRRWAILCLLLPAGFFLAIAMHSNVNVGLRHVFPIYPPIFVGIGWIAAATVHRWCWPATAVLTALGLWLAITTLAAYPDFIAFFNRAAGGERGGIRLLADSNLDWGQDLYQLVAWQHRHPDRPIYLAYFGLADPRYYGLRFTRLPGAQTYGDPPAWPKAGEGAVLAISANFLQGLFHTDPSFDRYYAAVAQHRPMEVLGGTIYIYSLGKKGAPAPATQPRSGPLSR